jgi:dTMP kinase
LSAPFITFEGGEGVGKSTQILLLSRRLEAAGQRVLRLREPGGTQVGEAIRRILLDPLNTSLCSTSELLLYEAARAQLVSEVIEPALAAGTTVLCDRYIDSTLAYQGLARGLGREAVERANAIGSRGCLPSRTILLERDTAEALNDARADGADRLEAEDLHFHELVHRGYRLIAVTDHHRIRTVACRASKAETAAAVFAELADLFAFTPEQARAAADFAITPELLEQVKQERSQ